MSTDKKVNANGANDKQVGGGHYKGKTIEPWDYITKNNLGYLEGNIIKYVTRHKDKGGVEDLRKAQHYLEKLIEVVEGGVDEEIVYFTADKAGLMYVEGSTVKGIREHWPIGLRGRVNETTK